jgi:adenylate cyclase, class 2
MLEVEMKFPVVNPDVTREKLHKLGFHQNELHHQVDCYFNAPDRDFAKSDEALRVRNVDDQSLLTYKGPKQGTTGKVRKETEVALAPGSATKMAAILKQLRYLPSVEVKKARTIYRHAAQKHVEVSWDEVEDLGTFVELEIMVPEGDQTETLACLQQLGEELGLGQEERRSYLELLLNAKR